MLDFIEKYRGKATAVLNGFDRIVFRGILRGIIHPQGMKRHLSRKDVPRRLFGQHVQEATHTLKEASLADAKQLNRPVEYLRSSRTRKEAVAREILLNNPVESGLICVLSCVEPCMSYQMYRNRQEKKLQLVYRQAKCLYLYHYFLDPVFGFMHARIQTWYPFTIQICMNGREWLARRMCEEGLQYVRHENSFPKIQDPAKAQSLMDDLPRLNWPEQLNRFAARINPAQKQLVDNVQYYWYAHQTEWATDISFMRTEQLQKIYPQLVWGAITTFSSRNVMRFLGKQLQRTFQGEVVSQFQHRPEGISIRHSVDANSVKMYDKAGCILRVETTINDPYAFKALRPKQGEPDNVKVRPLRKGVADLERRAHLSQHANERYIEALATFDTDKPLAQLLAPLTRRITRNGRKFRGLRPWDSGDLSLFQAISQPKFLISGFRNLDISTALYPTDQRQTSTTRAASARTSYRLRLLRAHGIIAKIPHTRRYRITHKGREISSALLIAQRATTQQLNRLAA